MALVRKFKMLQMMLPLLLTFSGSNTGPPPDVIEVMLPEKLCGKWNFLFMKKTTNIMLSGYT